MDDEAWVDRLRRVVAGDVARVEPEVDAAVGERPEPPVGLAGPTNDQAVADALRDLERRVSAVDIRLRQLNEEWDRLVDHVADAVVARLGERLGAVSD